jgi:hypothetical protein
VQKSESSVMVGTFFRSIVTLSFKPRGRRDLAVKLKRALSVKRSKKNNNNNKHLEPHRQPPTTNQQDAFPRSCRRLLAIRPPWHRPALLFRRARARNLLRCPGSTSSSLGALSCKFIAPLPLPSSSPLGTNKWNRDPHCSCYASSIPLSLQHEGGQLAPFQEISLPTELLHDRSRRPSTDRSPL